MSDDLLKLMGVSLRLGDCVELMRAMPDASVDSIVTDPPYHLTTARPGGRSEATRGAVMGGFMGMTWDGGDIAQSVEMWTEALRVLKPGGHLLAFSGTRTYHRMVCAIEDAGFEVRDQIGWSYGSGFPKSRNLDGEWQGWGTALKPAWEPICVARKPLIGTVSENILAHGTGALNIDGCRVPGEVPVFDNNRKGAGSSFDSGSNRTGETREGRWPANLIHDGSDEVLAAFPQAPGQMAKASTSDTQRAGQNTYGVMARGSNGREPRGDAGSAARFFYCAKASKSDRGEDNNHPTVKPTELMRYLCRLVTPPGGVVLDPFMGSGSTGKAAILERLQFIGIDMTAEYVEIARRRVLAALTRT